MKNWVLFRFPQQKDIHFIGSANLVDLDSIDINKLKTGFILRPFDVNKKASFIYADTKIINPNDDFINELSFNHKLNSYKSTPKEEYIKYVQDSIYSIKSDDFKKNVPAKIKSIEIKKQENLIDKFKNACKKYPNAFISLSSTQKYGVWLGATPEKLISVNKNNILETVALAGTQLSNGNIASEAAWSQKEIEEQALVSRYIINCFKEIRLREFEEIGPKTIVAGDLFHLKTSYKINLDEIENDNLASTLIDLLHPTSAVCGMPKKNALNFIQENEKFDRLIYSGFIGPINYLNETHIFVNLRTAQINSDSINLFAGAGVTEDSIPEKEWAETENKCEIIKSLFII